MICPACGKTIPNNRAEYCPFCGQRIVHGAGTPVQQNQAMPAREPVRKFNAGILIALLVSALVVIAGLIVCGIILTRNAKETDTDRSKTHKKQTESPVSDAQTRITESSLFAGVEDNNREDDAPGLQPEAPTPTQTEVETEEEGTEVSVDDIDPDDVYGAFDMQMEAFENYMAVLMLSEGDRLQNVGDTLEVQFSDEEMIRIAALAAHPDGIIDGIFVESGGALVLDNNAEAGPFGTGCHGWSISAEDVTEYGINIFGKDVYIDRLQTLPACFDFDAVRYEASTGTYVLQVSTETETEADMEFGEEEIRKTESGYFGEKDFFFGYWGIIQNHPNARNYRLSMGLRPDPRSEYGMVVTSLRIEKTAELTNY